MWGFVIRDIRQAPLCDDPLHPKPKLKTLNLNVNPLTTRVALLGLVSHPKQSPIPQTQKLKYETQLYNSGEFLSLLECHDPSTNATIPY